jgi:hypothetical protein
MEKDLSFAIEALPMHFMRKNEIHRAATIFEDNLGSSERLLSSPPPLFYSRHLQRALSVWLLLLPLGLWDPFAGTWNHVAIIPATAVISFFLFGIEELATQLVEPFTILPMQAFCDKIYNWVTEIASWEPNDNDMFSDSMAPEYLEAASESVALEYLAKQKVKTTKTEAGEQITKIAADSEPSATGSAVNSSRKKVSLRRLFGKKS